MNRMSFAWSDVSRPTRSPGRSSTGPEVVRTLTPNSFAISRASVVLPRPGGPKNRVWSRGSRRCFAASIAIWSDSLTFAWPTNSSSPDGRRAAARASRGCAAGARGGPRPAAAGAVGGRIAGPGRLGPRAPPPPAALARELLAALAQRAALGQRILDHELEAEEAPLGHGEEDL